MTTTKRIFWAALAAIATAAVTATPAAAGVMFNHSEPLTQR